jgi:protein-tyrosine phosphatase
MFPTRHQDAVSSFERLRSLIASARIPLALDLAAEIGPAAAVTEPLPELELRSIAGRFLLVEVLHDTPALTLETCVDRLEETGLTVIFAHPERSTELSRHLSALDVARGRGALVQVVAPSLLGRWGPAVEETAWRLVDTGRADLLGSDAHGVLRRRPHLQEAADLVAARVGEEVVRGLTERNPAAVLQGINPHAEGAASKTAGTR